MKKIENQSQENQQNEEKNRNVFVNSFEQFSIWMKCFFLSLPILVALPKSSVANATFLEPLIPKKERVLSEVPFVKVRDYGNSFINWWYYFLLNKKLDKAWVILNPLKFLLKMYENRHNIRRQKKLIELSNDIIENLLCLIQLNENILILIGSISFFYIMQQILLFLYFLSQYYQKETTEKKEKIEDFVKKFFMSLAISGGSHEIIHRTHKLKVFSKPTTKEKIITFLKKKEVIIFSTVVIVSFLTYLFMSYHLEIKESFFYFLARIQNSIAYFRNYDSIILEQETQNNKRIEEKKNEEKKIVEYELNSVQQNQLINDMAMSIDEMGVDFQNCNQKVKKIVQEKKKISNNFEECEKNLKELKIYDSEKTFALEEQRIESEKVTSLNIECVEVLERTVQEFENIQKENLKEFENIKRQKDLCEKKLQIQKKNSKNKL